MRSVLRGEARPRGKRPARNLHQEAARPHAHDVRCGDIDAGEDALQHPVEAVELERAGAAGEPQHPRFAEAGQEQEIAGVHRHAEVVDGSARLHDRCRHHIPPVDDGRRAGDEDDVAPLPVKLRDRLRHLGTVVGAADLGSERAVELGETRRDRARGRIEHALPRSRQAGLDQPDRARLERREAQHRPALVPQSRRSARRPNAHRGEGDHLDRRHHLARFDQGVRRHGAESHGLVEQIEPVHPRIVDDGETMTFGEDVAAAGEGLAQREPRPGNRAGDGLRRLVLAHVVALEARAGDGLDLRRPQRLDVIGGEHAPLLEGAAGQAHAVGEDQALGVRDRHVAEDHGATITCCRLRAAHGAPASPPP